MRPADAIGLVTTRLHPCACTYKKLQFVNCQSNHYIDGLLSHHDVVEAHATATDFLWGKVL